MTTANQKKFKGEIERYLLKTSFHFDSKIKEVFVSLKTRTCLCQSNIIKHDGYGASVTDCIQDNGNDWWRWFQVPVYRDLWG
jgi:hypothetical protein